MLQILRLRVKLRKYQNTVDTCPINILLDFHHKPYFQIADCFTSTVVHLVKIKQISVALNVKGISFVFQKVYEPFREILSYILISKCAEFGIRTLKNQTESLLTRCPWSA